jgi:tRNA(Arg) A34 adenosine deaminase TadA
MKIKFLANRQYFSGADRLKRVILFATVCVRVSQSLMQPELTKETAMPSHQDLMKAAVALGTELGKAVAILAKPDQPSDKMKIGTHDALLPHPAAAAVLHREQEDLVGWNLYLTYVPTQICMGLAWRAKVDRIFYMSNPNTIVEVNPAMPVIGAPGYVTAQSVFVLPAQLTTSKIFRRTFFLNLEGGKILSLPTVSGRPCDPRLGGTLNLGLINRQPVPGLVDNSVHDVFMRLVYALVRWGWNDDTPRGQRTGAGGARPFGNNIAGVIVSHDNKIIAWGMNMKHVNSSFHAETMMMQYYLKRNNVNSLPHGCRVYTSLECCNMCAGHVAELGHGTVVFYGQKDTNIAPTALARRVNGCSQFPSTVPHTAMLDRSQAASYGPTQTIDFLFDKTPGPDRQPRTAGETKGLLTHGSHLHSPLAPYANPAANAVAVEADKFLGNLQAAGVLVGIGGSNYVKQGVNAAGRTVWAKV